MTLHLFLHSTPKATATHIGHFYKLEKGTLDLDGHAPALGVTAASWDQEYLIKVLLKSHGIIEIRSNMTQ